MPCEGTQLGEALAANALKGFVTVHLCVFLKLAAIREYSAAAFHSAGMRFPKNGLRVDGILGFCPFAVYNMIFHLNFAFALKATFALMWLVTG